MGENLSIDANVMVKVFRIYTIFRAPPDLLLSHIPQSTIQNTNVHFSVLKGALRDMGQVYYGISGTGLFKHTHMYIVGISVILRHSGWKMSCRSIIEVSMKWDVEPLYGFNSLAPERS